MRHSLYPVFFSIALLLLISCKDDQQEIPDTNNQPQKSPYDLYINEIDIASSPDWIEIYNPGTQSINLTAAKIFDSKHRSFTVPTGTIISSKGFVVVYFDDTTRVNAFTLSALPGNLSLYDSENRRIDSISYPGMPEGVSYGRWPDGCELWTVNEFPSPSMSNDPSTNKPPLIYKFRITNIHPLPIETLSVSAYFEDDHRVNSAWLRYWYNQTDTIVQLFQVTCGSGYTTIIPPLPSGTDVHYYLYADDDSALLTYFPANAPANFYSYTVQ